MEAKYEARKQELLEECSVAPEVIDRVLPRLEQFMKPFVEHLVRTEQVEHAHTFVQGLLSDLEHKNVESIAYRFGQDRMPLQWFVGMSDWDHEPLRDELARQVGEQLGEEDAVIVFDPSGFPKSGKESVGAARQWCGRLGKVDNCQVAVYLGYASSKEHALVDTRLFLPKEWTQNKARREKAGVPKGVRYRTRHQLCLEMLAEHGDRLPHAWVAGDDEMGRPYWFRKRLNTLGERYLLAVACNTQIRDLEVDPPAYSGRGRYPKRPWTRVDEWAATLGKRDWTRIDVRDGSKGPLIVEVAKRRVVARTEKRQEGHEETLVVICFRDRDNRALIPRKPNLPASPKPSTALRNASSAPRAKRAWRTTKFATGRAGIITKSCRSSPRGFWCAKHGGGKKWTPAITVQQIREAISSILTRRCGCGIPSRIRREREQRLTRNELARLYHWKQHKRLAPLNISKRQI
jgi:hypothetical protein